MLAPPAAHGANVQPLNTHENGNQAEWQQNEPQLGGNTLKFGTQKDGIAHDRFLIRRRLETRAKLSKNSPPDKA